MGLLDIVGGMLGGQGGDQNSTLAAHAMDFINNQPGGLQGLVGQFEQNGAGGVIQSWIGGGSNQAISGDQLESVLGTDAIQALASKAGIDPSQASGLLAQVLPHVVNGATPDGQVPAGGQIDSSAVSGVISQIAGLFGGGNQS